MSEPTPKDIKWLRWVIAGAPIFSTCSKGQYMAAIVASDGHLIGTGYNGGPKGFPHCVDGGCPRAKNDVPSGTPYDYGEGLCVASHAELNAIVHSAWEVRAGSTIYVNGTPCFGCAKTIANSGISRVVYLEDERLGSDEAVWIMNEVGIEVIPLTWLEIGV